MAPPFDCVRHNERSSLRSGRKNENKVLLVRNCKLISRCLETASEYNRSVRPGTTKEQRSYTLARIWAGYDRDITRI
jgi:hypothetical protein